MNLKDEIIEIQKNKESMRSTRSGKSFKLHRTAVSKEVAMLTRITPHGKQLLVWLLIALMIVVGLRLLGWGIGEVCEGTVCTLI